jgi:hypothetical protein
MGVPSRSEVDTWVLHHFNGQVRPVLESLMMHPSKSLVCGHVILIPAIRPIIDTRAMVKTASDEFMDEARSVWNVRQTDKGERFLMKISKEDIDNLLLKFEKKTRSASVHHRPILAEVWKEMQSNPEVGDKVSFSHQGSVLHGLVDRLYPDGSIKVVADGKEIKVERPKILEVKKVPRETSDESDTKLIDFFTKAYGDRGFATKLVTM